MVHSRHMAVCCFCSLPCCVMLASLRLAHGFHGTKDRVYMNLGSFVCVRKPNKTTEAGRNVLTEKLTYPRALGTAGFGSSDAVWHCLSLALIFTSI